MMNDKLIEFCSYVQPILNSCLGFVKTEGYVTHIPGKLLAMSSDESVFVEIKIPVIFDIYVTAIVGRLLQLKDDESKSNLMDEVYFTGWNIKAASLMRYDSIYSNLNDGYIFDEPDVYNINGFTDVVSSTSMGSVFVSDGCNRYMVPASKSITSLTKQDSANLRLYNYVLDPNNDSIKTVKYNMYKKKFKLFVNIYMNIIVV